LRLNVVFFNQRSKIDFIWSSLGLSGLLAIRSVLTCCAIKSYSLRKEALNIVGGFDTHFFLYCDEEDLALRMHENNYDIYLLPSFSPDTQARQTLMV
jgi:GT2 family glycosyltransferase